MSRFWKKVKRPALFAVGWAAADGSRWRRRSIAEPYDLDAAAHNERAASNPTQSSPQCRGNLQPDAFDGHCEPCILRGAVEYHTGQPPEKTRRRSPHPDRDDWLGYQWPATRLTEEHRKKLVLMANAKNQPMTQILADAVDQAYALFTPLSVKEYIAEKRRAYEA